MRKILIVVMGGVISFATACGGSTDGSALPSPEATSDTPSLSGTTAAPATPERPRSFDLSAVDPCTLITAAQQAQLMATQPPMSGSSDPSMPDCSFNSLTGASYAVFIDLTSSASAVVSGASGTVQGSAEIDGFSIPLLSADGTSACSGFVDTGDGQYLSVQANGTGQIPVADLCELVQPAIKIVLDNLAILQP